MLRPSGPELPSTSSLRVTITLDGECATIEGPRSDEPSLGLPAFGNVGNHHTSAPRARTPLLSRDQCRLEAPVTKATLFSKDKFIM